MNFYLNTNKDFKKKIQFSYRDIIKLFRKTSLKFSILKIVFTLLIVLEICFSFIFSYNSYLFAISLVLMVLTVFIGVSLVIYLNTKKSRWFIAIKNDFISICKKHISIPIGVIEHHLSIANALLKLSYHMNGLEYTYFPSKVFGKLSLFFHKEDVFLMREICLLAAIKEHVEQIKNTPTDLELHVSLAHSYVALSKLYLDKMKMLKKQPLKQKFEKTLQRAIEEFSILKDFSPNDPWIHAELAQCYQSLNMYEKQAEEYESILEISPNDLEIKFRLAKVYFQLGKNYDGLMIYEQLQKQQYTKAEKLLNFYSPMLYLEDMEF